MGFFENYVNKHLYVSNFKINRTVRLTKKPKLKKLIPVKKK